MKRLSDICGKSGQVKGTEKSKKGGEVDQQKCLQKSSKPKSRGLGAGTNRKQLP